jgi:hypothetical protein
MVDYVRWLAAEVSCLPEVFVDVNEIFVFATIEGMLVIAGDSVDLATLQASIGDTGAYILLGSGMSRKLPTLSRDAGGIPSATSLRLLPFG